MHPFDNHARARHARPRGLMLALLAGLLPLHGLAAQEHDHTHGHGHDLHFTHPLLAESVSPDTKLRLDYSFQELEAEEDESELELEGEYAFARSFSIEAGAHFHPEAGEFGETHVIFKFANYAFEQEGVLLGYGIEFGLPTGTAHEHGGDHGHQQEDPHGHAEPEDDIYEITPFLNVGWTTGPWELVGWTLFEIPTNQSLQENVGTELRYNASVLYDVSARLEALVEAFGHAGLSGPETDRTVVNVAPGLRAQLLSERPLVLGAALALPLTDERDFDARVLVSAFWHF